jgi:nucleotide-binding universal stress UspA family protein
VLRWTKGFAEEYGSEVTLAHATPGFETRPQMYMDRDFSAALMESAKEELKKAQGESATAWPVRVAPGEAGHVLRCVAKDVDADVAIIGRSEMHGLGRLRSNAYAIIRDAPCPVISV